MITYRELLIQAKEYLHQHQVPDADIDAWYLFERYLNINRTEFMLNSDKQVGEESIQEFRQMLEKRANRIPLQHILGVTEFMGLPFYVDENVLCPRQDTETLVEQALPLCQGKKVLDMCTGSGCIAISIACLAKGANVTASDISKPALDIAQRNAKTNQVDIQLINSDLFDHINDRYDIIVSNPPYIRTDEISKLMPEVRDHEPLIALDGTEDGLYFYERLAREAGTYLNEAGVLMLEIGYDQAKDVTALLIQNGFTEVTVIQDLAGHDRVVKGIKNV